MTSPSTSPPVTPGPARNALGETRTRVLVRRGVIVLIVLACVGGLAWAASRTRRGDQTTTVTGSEGGPNPSVVQLLTPSDGDTLVNHQSQIGIVLTAPYKAFLIVDGTEIPRGQLLERPEVSAVYFTPGEGKVFKELPPGRNCIEAVVSRVDGKPEAVAPVRWCFNVA